MGTQAERVRCVQCGSNNMPGKDRCWQCGASLPPPESAPASYGPTPARRTGTPPILIGCVLAVLLVAGGLAAILLQQVSVRSAVATPTRPQWEIPPVSDPSALDPNSPEQGARRELQRLRGRLGYTPVPADATGRVPLGTGGSLSAEEYRRALDAVRKP